MTDLQEGRKVLNKHWAENFGDNTPSRFAVEVTDMGNDLMTKSAYLEERYDFVIREKVWTPLGQFSPETLDQQLSA